MIAIATPPDNPVRRFLRRSRLTDTGLAVLRANRRVTDPEERERLFKRASEVVVAIPAYRQRSDSIGRRSRS